MASVDRHLAGCPLPLEIKGLRQRHIPLAAVVDIANLLAVPGDRPAEHPHIADTLANLESGQQLAIADRQLQQAGVLVIGVQLVEIVDEAGVTQSCPPAAPARPRTLRPDPANRYRRRRLLSAFFSARGTRCSRTAMHRPPARYPGHAVVLGTDAHPPDDLHTAVAKGLLTLVMSASAMDLSCARSCRRRWRTSQARPSATPGQPAPAPAPRCARRHALLPESR